MCTSRGGALGSMDLLERGVQTLPPAIPRQELREIPFRKPGAGVPVARVVLLVRDLIRLLALGCNRHVASHLTEPRRGVDS